MTYSWENWYLFLLCEGWHGTVVRAVVGAMVYTVVGKVVSTVASHLGWTLGLKIGAGFLDPLWQILQRW